MWAGLAILLKNLPAIVEALISLGKLAESGVEFIDVRLRLTKFDKANDKADTGDTSDLEDLFRGKPGTPR